MALRTSRSIPGAWQDGCPPLRLPRRQVDLCACLVTHSHGSQSGREISLEFFSWGLTGQASYIFGLCKKECYQHPNSGRE